MSNATALRVAIDLALVPSRVRMLKAARLPESVPFLLRIAAGDRDATQEAAELTGTPETVQAAAAFFIEQILFAHDSDSYRIVGTRQSATAAELRRNLPLLLKWLDADAGQNAERSISAGRVTGARNNLKTPERRAAYDMARNARETEHRTRRADRSNGSSTVPRHHNETGYSRGATSGQLRQPSRAIGVFRRKREGLLRRVFSFVLGRTSIEHGYGVWAAWNRQTVTMKMFEP